jgi:hypothetical protein
MEALIEFIKENPLYAAGTAVLLLFFIISLVKKAAKLAVLAIALNLGYGYYLNDLAQAYYAEAQQRMETARDNYEAAKETVQGAGETVEQAGDLFDQASGLIER